MSLGVPQQLAVDPPRRPRRVSLPPRGRFGAFLSGLLAVGTLVVLLVVNHARGDVLQRFLADCASGGSGKWRGNPDLKHFFTYTFILAFVALGLAIGSAVRWREDASSALERWCALAPIAVAVGVVSTFVALGVPSVVFA